jgi:hypothetical protein
MRGRAARERRGPALKLTRRWDDYQAPARTLRGGIHGVGSPVPLLYSPHDEGPDAKGLSQLFNGHVEAETLVSQPTGAVHARIGRSDVDDEGGGIG